MGFGKGHTQVCFAASLAKQNTQAFEDERLSLLGDSFACSSFMILAAAAGYPFTRQFSISQMQQRLGLPPGYSSHISMSWPMGGLQADVPQPPPMFSVKDINVFLALRANHTGSDVRITTGEIMNPRQVSRQSVCSEWWDWRQVFTLRWDFEEHINPLECRGILLSLLWQIRQGQGVASRLFHLTDSYVCQSILSKGRTSSKAMQHVVRRINAVLLACHSVLILGHVDSADNPTDEGSRQG